MELHQTSEIIGSLNLLILPMRVYLLALLETLSRIGNIKRIILNVASKFDRRSYVSKASKLKEGRKEHEFIKY